MTIDPRYRVYVATAGVFLGAGIVSLSQRLLSVGLPDVRGALGLGFDEAAWIPTAFNMAQMFMGPLTIYLAVSLGPRRLLLISAPIFALASCAVPFATSYWTIIAFQVIAGLASGTFYPLALSFALSSLPPKYTMYGIGAFSLEIIATLSVSTRLEGWFVEHWSYRWIFWAGPVLALALMLLVQLSLPNPAKRPPPKVKPNFSGFLFACAGLTLIYGTLEQGERLDWLNSSTIVAMLVSGGFLLAAAGVRRALAPNPLVNLGFLLRRNTLILGFGLFSVRFLLLAMLLLVPGFLGVVQGYRPLETGRVLSWSVLPILSAGLLAAHAMRRIDGRIVSATGLGLVAASALINSVLSSTWVDRDFFAAQVLLAAGITICLAALIGMIAQQIQETGAVQASGVVRPVDVLTYAAFFQTVRLFGGQSGVALIQRLVNQREMFHSNRLGYSIQAGNFGTDEHVRALTGGFFSASPSLDDAQGRALVALGGQVRRQAYTLAYADGFVLIAVACVAYLLLLALMKPMKSAHDTALSSVPN